MAVIWNSLTFGSVNSLDYGIYVTGDAVYNAPERAVERVSVPGRNGDIIIDQGHWNNIEVSYPCGTFAETASDFATKIATLRNAIVSQIGYQRLSDTYNDNEYRMADASAGFDVTPTLGRAGEFTLTFNCKPQRWLMSGEATVTVADGDTLVNPSLYESYPLLAVDGYGTVGFNGYEIELNNDVLGNVWIQQGGRYNSLSAELDTALFNPTDRLRISGLTRKWTLTDLLTNYHINSVSAGTDSGGGTTTVTTESYGYGTIIYGSTKLNTISFPLNSNYSADINYTFTINATPVGGTAQDYVTIASCIVRYDADTHSLYIGINFTQPCTKWSDMGANEFQASVGVYIDSTVPVLGNPTYIDCDLGEAYKYDGDVLVPLNRYIELGSRLPCLGKGENLISADSTITELKITPRWYLL